MDHLAFYFCFYLQEHQWSLLGSDCLVQLARRGQKQFAFRPAWPLLEPMGPLSPLEGEVAVHHHLIHLHHLWSSVFYFHHNTSLRQVFLWRLRLCVCLRGSLKSLKYLRKIHFNQFNLFKVEPLQVFSLLLYFSRFLKIFILLGW